MKYALAFGLALLAACASPVQSLIYAAAGQPYMPEPRVADNPPLFQKRAFTRPDGQTRQYFWHETASASHTILYLHGNAEIAARTARSNLLAGLGGDTAILEYTGYGPNSGTPSEAELVKDATAMVAHLKRAKPGQKLILVGFSIGGSLAAIVAAQGREPEQEHKRIDGLVTIATFTTLREIVPAVGRALIGPDNAYDTRAAAARITVPWAMLHCAGDPIIPARMARELLAAPNAGQAMRHLRVSGCDSHFVPVRQWPQAIAKVKERL